MGNTWAYHIMLPDSPADRSGIVARVFAKSQSLGYALHKEISLFDNEGDEHQFTSPAECYDYLAAHGGLVTTFDNQETLEHDMYLAFNWEGKQISTGSGSDFARRRDGDMAADLRAMFILLCKELRPFYGYSSDEWMVEFAFASGDFQAQWQAFEQAVREQRVPPLLFWLNYFAADFFERVGEERLARVPHHIVPLEDRGVFVYLSDIPWEGKLAILGDDGRYKIQ
jgi:hypothetical protein